MLYICIEICFCVYIYLNIGASEPFNIAKLYEFLPNKFNIHHQYFSISVSVFSFFVSQISFHSKRNFDGQAKIQTIVVVIFLQTLEFLTVDKKGKK